MTEIEYSEMDIYDRLELIIATCGKARMGLESIVDEYAAHDYIIELLDELEHYVPIFINDLDFNNSRDIVLIFKEIMNDIIPLIKVHKVDYTYLIDSLKDIENRAEKRLPDNIRQARFLDNLINQSKEISELCGIDQETYLDIIYKLRKNSDAISDIIEHPKENIKSK